MNIIKVGEAQKMNIINIDIYWLMETRAKRWDR